MQYEIQVTERDIKRGVKGSPHYCPIAIAAKRALRKRLLSVGSDGIELGNPLRLDNPFLVIPTRAHDFMEQFDAGETVAPLTFTAYTTTAPKAG